MARTLKAKRLICQSLAIDFRKYVPPREVSHRLVQSYFRTYETVFRVLHVPAFQQEFSHYWDNPQAASESFVIKLLLVMAIGTCFYNDPDNAEDSLRDSSSQWISAAQLWLSAVFEKRRLSLSGIQIYCLLLLARQTNVVGGDLSWITAGSLVRTAMSIGLHRDPTHFPNMSVFHAELRRRLWATILEIVVQSSLDSGMPPLISCEDYDSDPPSNIDDAQINEETETLPTSKPLDTFTQTSTQCALMRSLPIRLKVVNALNSIHSDLSYEDTLRLGSELTNAYRSNSLLFKSFLVTPSSMSQIRPTAFQMKFLDLLSRRFLLSLHTPFAQKANDNIAYYYSRRICLETSFLLLSYSVPAPLHGIQVQDDYTCLRIFGSGLFKSILIHATVVICVELIAQIREDSSLSTSSLSRNELYSVVKDSVDITRRRVLAGETSVKAHVCFACALSQIDAMQSGTSSEQAVSNATKTSLESCYAILEARAGRTGSLLDDETDEGRRGLGNQGDFDEPRMSEFSVSLDRRYPTLIVITRRVLTWSADAEFEPGFRLLTGLATFGLGCQRCLVVTKTVSVPLTPTVHVGLFRPAEERTFSISFFICHRLL